MCRFWISTGCELKEEELSKLKSNLLSCLRPGGPDSQNFLEHNNAYSFHSRLAIQDLSPDSDQPLVADDGSVLVFNGEIFNWPEIYNELNLSKINVPKSDTQFLFLLLQKKLLKKYIAKFRGFFSFAYFEPIEKSITVARDCFGVKPLYYALIENKCLVFASTSEAVVMHPLVKKDLDPKSMNLFMRYGFFSHNSSPYKNIEQVNPGILFKYELDIKYNFVSISKEKDFSLKTLAFNKSNANKNIFFREDYFTDLLEKSCKLRLLSDVPSSLLLSGGIDSSLLALIYAKRLGTKLPCFTLQFENSSEGDETNIARQTASLLGLEHHVLGFNSNSISEYIEKVFNSLDQPFIDTSILPTHILCNLISDKYKVAISADGGDESFAGYPKYQRNKKILRILEPLSLINKSFYKILQALDMPNQLIEKAINSLSGTQELFKDIYFQQHQIWKTKTISELMKGMDFIVDNSYYEDLITNKSLSKLAQLQILDISFYMRDDILYKIDRASMANGLELREPFLDQSIVSYGLCLDDEEKLKLSQGKNCLRKLIHKELPHLSNLKKKGFGIPEEILNNSEFMKDMSSDCFKKGSLLWDILDKKYVIKLLKNKDLTSNQSWQLRSLIVWANVKNI